MTNPEAALAPCDNGHDYRPRRTFEEGNEAAKYRTTTVLAVYCRKCGEARELDRDRH